MTIAENIARIRANMAAAAREAGRDPKEILLVGASKMNDAAACREAVAAGIDALGENRVQEMVQKLEQHAYDGAPLHFIGHLQRNKVKQVVGHVALIQSVGSLELLDEIEKVAAARGLVQDILLEVNIGREACQERLCTGESPPRSGGRPGADPCPGAGTDDDSPGRRADGMPISGIFRKFRHFMLT